MNKMVAEEKKRKQLKFAFTLNLLILFSFYEMHRGHSDIFCIYFPMTEGKACQKSFIILQKLLQGLQSMIFQFHFQLSRSVFEVFIML